MNKKTTAERERWRLRRRLRGGGGVLRADRAVPHRRCELFSLFLMFNSIFHDHDMMYHDCIMHALCSIFLSTRLHTHTHTHTHTQLD